MRVLVAAILGISLTGCSVDLDSLPIAGIPPTLSAVAADIRKTADDAKLIPPLQVAGPIPANAVSSVPWIICLRSGATEASQRLTYSVFYNNNEFKSFRLSVIIEGCDGQSYSPLK